MLQCRCLNGNFHHDSKTLCNKITHTSWVAPLNKSNLRRQGRSTCFLHLVYTLTYTEASSWGQDSSARSHRDSMKCSISINTPPFFCSLWRNSRTSLASVSDKDFAFEAVLFSVMFKIILIKYHQLQLWTTFRWCFCYKVASTKDTCTCIHVCNKWYTTKKRKWSGYRVSFKFWFW